MTSAFQSSSPSSSTSSSTAGADVAPGSMALLTPNTASAGASAHPAASPIASFGTPLSESGFRVMLLGSGELGKEVVIALQRLGVEVIAVDRYPNAPAHQVAHRAHVIDMTDPAALRALIEAEKPDLIVPEIEAIATDTLAAIEQEGIARVVPTARATQLTMNREGIRRLAAETLNLPTSPYAFADSREALEAAIHGDSQNGEATGTAGGIGYPCVVKPVMSSSGKGQSVLRSAADLDPAWAHAMAGGRVAGTRIIVEGFIDFDYEITQLTVRALGDSGETETFFCEPIGHRQVDGDYVESWQPQPMSPVALARVKALSHEVTTALGGRGLFGVEAFVRGDEVWFSEVSPRPHDTGLVTLCTQRYSEFDLHARAILGLPVDPALREPGASAVIYGGIEAVGIGYEGVAEALKVPGADLRLFGKPESFVKRRMGVAVATGANIDEARERARTAAACVKPTAPGQ